MISASGAALRIKPFRIDISDAVLEDLHERLHRTRFPEQLPDAAWDYGTELGYLRELVAYWRDVYDWRAREARMNWFDQYMTEIDGATVHFMHVRSPEPDALPIVITHGWPGSVVEFLDVIGPLSDPRASGGDPSDAFDVVCPSLPGYAFSGPTKDRGPRALGDGLHPGPGLPLARQPRPPRCSDRLSLADLPSLGAPERRGPGQPRSG